LWLASPIRYFWQRKEGTELSEENEERTIPEDEDQATEHVYEFDGGNVISIPDPLDEEEVASMEGLFQALNSAPVVDEHIVHGRVEEAITTFQKAVGISREEAEVWVKRLMDDARRVRRAQLRRIVLFLIMLAGIVLWLTNR
jgi:hypothetical protein